MQDRNREDTAQSGVEVAGDLAAALEEEKAKAAKYLGNWQRTEADFDNYRKRLEQEKGDTVKYANAALILNLLPVLDDLERAFKSLPEKLAHLSWTEGIRLIHRKLQATLEAQGVCAINALGERFDPAIHEAVAQGPGEEGKVVDEAQKGYTLHGRVIRPAYVVVGKGVDDKAERNGTSDDQGG
jgi:molecular chaperone GrpE